MKDFYKNNGIPSYRTCKWCELFEECETGQRNKHNNVNLTTTSITCDNYVAKCKRCGKDISTEVNWQDYCDDCHKKLIEEYEKRR